MSEYEKIRLLMPILSLTTGLIATIPLIACAKNQPVVENKYCTVTTVSQCQLSIKISAWVVRSGATMPNFQYSSDNGKTWKEVQYKTDSTGSLSFDDTLPANANIIFKGNNPNGLPNVINGSINICFKNDVDLSGNIMSLLDDGKGTMTEIPNNNCFKSLFYQSHIRHVSEGFLTATKLKPYCYESLFMNCEQLLNTPNLPNMNLETGCYSKMFYGCKSLVTPPALPATKLAEKCYDDMFWQCDKLTSIPDLPANKLETSCYTNMFNKCVSLKNVNKDLFKNVAQLANNCFEGMFARCENLENPPLLPCLDLKESCYKTMFNGCKKLSFQDDFILPAKKLAKSCYHGMFNGCESLTHTAKMSADSYADYCFNLMYANCTFLQQPMDSLPNAKLYTNACNSMFANCTSLKVAPKLPSTDLGGEEAVMNCYSYMFLGCEKLEKAPDLPAITLSGACYQGMFQNCTNLHSITVGFTSWTDAWKALATQGWFEGSSEIGEFHCKQELIDSDTENKRFGDGWGVPAKLDKEGTIKSKWSEIVG